MSKILIVDDIPAMRLLLESIMAKLGHETKCSETGKDALTILKEDPQFDLVILDICLDDMDGFEVIRQIRNDLKNTKTKICFISGKRTRQDVIRAISLGGSDYIVKPIDPLVVIEKTKSLLDGNGNQVFAQIESKMRGSLTGASIQVEFIIYAVSEKSMLIESSMPFTVPGFIDITVPFLNESLKIGPAFQCKVSSCKKNKTGTFTLETEFVGMSNQESDIIRSCAIKRKKLISPEFVTEEKPK